MFILTCICVCLPILFVDLVHGSTLTGPPLSAVVAGFDGVYDLSLFANTLSDQGIDVTLIVPETIAHDLYENLIDVEVYKLNVSFGKSDYPEDQALKFCERLLDDKELSQKIQEIQPTFTLFPALRHDGCLLPWIKSIDSIPVVLTRNAYEEIYAFERTGVALPILQNSFWSRVSTNLAWRSISSKVESNYVKPAFKLAKEHLPNVPIEQDNLYSDVRLVLWGADTVLRKDFASLTEMLVEVGCHHCREPQPLPDDLRKLLVEHNLNSVIVLLDGHYKSLIEQIVEKLPRGRQGYAVVWKNTKLTHNKEEKLPESLYLWQDVDRQDLIGNGRTRVLLSHCADTELLETAFHGTPVICFPRDAQESKNADRAVQLGFALAIANADQTSSEDIANLIRTIHTTTDYRENARRVSVALRHRLNPASDRLAFWLLYVARTKGYREKFLEAPARVSTFNEDFQFFIGLCTGVIVGLLLACIGFLLRYVIMSDRIRKSKGRYER
ncbi:hypothetical protein KPH14_001205 [Odynerus spinipes]|uniref:UDP-glycosyltransferase n=1 Tax=Odynerus spinipes TaxID=1348599 RepID=A0AAD9RQE3_9HYME|nr:hypothetical protein KPH14_001205 [Odynerus spinipes]